MSAVNGLVVWTTSISSRARRRASQRARAGSGEARNTTRFIGRFFTSFMPVDVELVEILQQLGPAVGGGGERRQRGDVVVGNRHFERGPGPVVLPLLELRPTVGLERHAETATHGGPHVDVAGIEEVEDVPHVILPAVAVEGAAVVTAEALEPLIRGRGKILLCASATGGKKYCDVVLCRSAITWGRQRTYTLAQGLALRLRLRQLVPVHVEPVVIVAAPDGPRLGLLECRRLVGSHRHRVVPRREALVAIGILRRVDQHHTVLENGLASPARLKPAVGRPSASTASNPAGSLPCTE